MARMEAAARRHIDVLAGGRNRRHRLDRIHPARPQYADSIWTLSCRRRIDCVVLGRNDQPDLSAVVLSMGFVVGLTGGIGSGKTTVAELFASRGAGLVDTDEIAHRLPAPAQPAIAELSSRV